MPIKLIIFVMALAMTTNAYAVIKTVGTGDKLTFDKTAIPAQFKDAYAIMSVKCIKCHTMERTVVAIRSGIAPISGSIFDRNSVKAYGIKMLRKPDSDMNKKDYARITEVMNFFLDEAAK